MEIKKIKNLKTSITEEQIKNDWNEIKSFRNRLLQNSDWIFVPDNNLEEECIGAWITWRSNVRRCEEFKDITRALKYLNDLQNNCPPVRYKASHHHSVELYKIDLTKMLRKIIKATMDNLYNESETREIIVERFEQALQYLSGNTQDNFLIELEAEHSGDSIDEVANRFINDKKNYYLKLITIERVKNQFIKRIETVDNLSDCDKIRDDLTILGSKKWI
jgi:hypothetical protein